MKKYTNYFKSMQMVALAFGLTAVSAGYEHLSAICALCTAFWFAFWFAGVMAPDSEKYTPKYLREKKGWS